MTIRQLKKKITSIKLLCVRLLKSIERTIINHKAGHISKTLICCIQRGVLKKYPYSY